MIILDTKHIEYDGPRPQGRLQYRIYEDFIAQYTLSGPVDRLLMKHFAAIHREAVGKMKKARGTWGSFVVFHDVDSVSDGALEELGNYLSKLGETGKLSSHMAVVYPRDLPLSVAEQEAFLDCLVGVGVTCRSFWGEQEALNWLRFHIGI